MEHAGFTRLVEEKWASSVRGTTQFRLAKRISAFKSHLREFNFKEFSELTKRTREAVAALEELKRHADADSANATLRWQVNAQRKKTGYLQNAEREYYVQKAKLKHSLLSDRCTSFFHSLVNRNNTRNYISFLHSTRGIVTWNQEEIISEFVEYYTDLLGTKKILRPIDAEVVRRVPRTSPQDRQDLVRPITDAEIKAAIFSIGDSKALGPDGYSAAFFKKQWDLVGADVICVVKEFFETGRLLKNLNTTIITLIPKTSINPSVADYRPISCCNVVYKTITKILSARMTPLLGKLVHMS